MVPRSVLLCQLAGNFYAGGGGGKAALAGLAEVGGEQTAHAAHGIDDFIGKLKAKKFMTYSHENMILVCPPLIITPEQLREEMVKLDEVLAEVDATL